MLRLISSCAFLALALRFGDPAPARAGNEPEKRQRRVEEDILPKLVLACGAPLSMTYDDAAWFDLQPGLYNMAWTFGCWHDHTMAGPGHMTILLRRPGEDALLPIKPEDFVR